MAMNEKTKRCSDALFGALRKMAKVCDELQTEVRSIGVPQDDDRPVADDEARFYQASLNGFQAMQGIMLILSVNNDGYKKLLPHEKPLIERDEPKLSEENPFGFTRFN
jgi:hypothetical protein